jgi:predicted membrane protein (TIGR00267 family)
MPPEFSVIEFFRRKIREYRRISQVDEIARRYLTMNTFDGVLGMLGILTASFLAGIHSSISVISACIGSSIAIGLSGFYGAYMTERAERKGKIKKLEKALYIHLKHSHIDQAHRYATIILALINGLSSAFASILIIMPFLIGLPTITAYYISMGLAFMMLFAIGFYLGRISNENSLVSGVKLIIVGAILAIILLIVEMPKPWP